MKGTWQLARAEIYPLLVFMGLILRKVVFLLCLLYQPTYSINISPKNSNKNHRIIIPHVSIKIKVKGGSVDNHWQKLASLFLLWEFSVAICHESLSLLFIEEICRCYLSWLLAIGIYRSYTPRWNPSWRGEMAYLTKRFHPVHQ